MIEESGTETAATIVAMERAALDRWCKGDPSGFLEISARDVAYFDPFLGARLDGLEALTSYYESLRASRRVGWTAPCASRIFGATYGMSMVENLESIRDIGLEGFVAQERDRWKCLGCGAVICVHRAECIYCGLAKG